MSTRGHARRTAGGKDGLDGFGRGKYLMGFEELYRQEGNRFQRFHCARIDVQQVTEISVYGVVRMLEPEGLQCGLDEFFVRRNGEDVGCGNHPCKGKIKNPGVGRGFYSGRKGNYLITSLRVAVFPSSVIFTM